MGRAQIIARAMNFRCRGGPEAGSERPSDEAEAASPAPGGAGDIAAARAAAEAAALEGAMKTVTPVIRTYLYPGDVTSRRRFALLALVVAGGLATWLGPTLGLLVVDPLIWLGLAEQAVLTADSDCLDPRVAASVAQPCAADVHVDYFFWNLTNADAWRAGAAPPAYEEVGPYAFAAREARYGVEFSDDWTEVEYTFHQWADFLPEKSCAACALGAPLTGVNRGYLQFLAGAAAAGGPLDPESGLVLQLTPITLAVVRASISGALAAAGVGAGDAAALAAAVAAQWSSCGVLLPYGPALGLTSPYLKDVPLPPGAAGFPFDPEMCKYVSDAASAQVGASVAPADLAGAGLAVDASAAAAFLTLAIGASNATYLDPAAAGFAGAFMTLPRGALLGAVDAAAPAAAAALAAIPEAQWPLFQGYLMSLIPTWGTLVLEGWLAAGGGGLVVTKPVSAWLHGFDDPLLKAAAEGAAAAAGAPGAERLAPWTYRPALALTFEAEATPTDYFTNVTGTKFDVSMLTWNASGPGFHPLVQQKRLATGRAEGEAPQAALRSRGLAFTPRPWAVTNVTGAAEGAFFLLDGAAAAGAADARLVAWDSVLSYPVELAPAGPTAVKKIDAVAYGLSSPATEACNWVHYAAWAEARGFDPDAYRAAFAGIPPADYWRLMTDDAALAAYLNSSALGAPLSAFFADRDPSRDRCAQPDAWAGAWDMSALLACPTLYTAPHFLNADARVVAATGVNLTGAGAAGAAGWNPDDAAHGYALAVEPRTGITVRGHRAYQVSHPVARTALLNPALWVAPGSAAAASAPADFVVVPTFWARLWWEPSDGAAAALRVALAVADGLYYALVAAWPVAGALMLLPALGALRLGADAKARRAALPALQASAARPTRLTNAERASVSAESAEAGGGESGEGGGAAGEGGEGGGGSAAAVVAAAAAPAPAAPPAARPPSSWRPRSPASARVAPAPEPEAPAPPRRSFFARDPARGGASVGAEAPAPPAAEYPSNPLATPPASRLGRPRSEPGP